MTNFHQENPENGHHITDGGNSDDGNISVKIATTSNKISELNPEQQFKILRQKMNAIAFKMRPAENLDTLLQTTVMEIRDKIESDRALIYRFNSPDSGEVVAESRTIDWTPAFGETLPAIIFSATSKDYLEPVAINDIQKVELTPYQFQLLEKFQVKASLNLPIMLEGQVWGLLIVHNCSQSRQWQEFEINLLSQVTGELTQRLQRFELKKQLQQQLQEQKSVARVIDKIQRVKNIDNIFQTTTQEVRQLIQCDRLALYRFNPDWSGEFVSESVADGWVRVVGPDIKTVWADTHLQETQGGRYAKGESFVVNDIYKVGHAKCHIEILEQFQVKAYVIVPVFAREKLWGLLAAYQNSRSRAWQGWEVSLLTQIGMQFCVALSQAEYLQQVRVKSEQLALLAEQEKALTKVVTRIRQSLDIDTIFKTTTQEVRQLLQCDRLAVYRFNPDWSGEFVAESVDKGWIPLREQQFDKATQQANGDSSIRNLGGINKVKDTYLQQTQGGRYQQKISCVVDDVEKAGFSPCYLELLEQLEAKAYLTVPIFKENKLWGLLAAYQNSAPRHWEEFEVNVLNQIAGLLEVAMQQAETLEKMQQQSEEVTKAANRDRAVAKVINRIRQSLDIDTIFTITTKEVRSLLNTDRVGVYRFNPDWSGEFVSESVGTGWVYLVEKQCKIECQQESISDCIAMRNLIASSKQQTNGKRKVADTHLQDTQGGRFRNQESIAVADIYKAGFSDCYIEVLEEYQAKAYAIVPIFQGQQLWGMLGAYQNNGSREWEEAELSLLTQIGNQLGIALQQAEYLQKLQAQSNQLEEAAAREKSAKELLQQGAIQLLAAVRPALNGNLTVRAPITENELGTIADAYNNTLQALREIVIQVQQAAQQMAQTCSSSDASLTGLTTLAQQQSEEITEALGEMQKMVDSTQAVTSNAELVQVAVQQANQTVESGDGAMNRTVEAIQAIRETVAQTGKKIKRLSESSQKISKVVNLISNFATQTNVLALNAAIEATRAGEYGKGFAVVADEVRSLSRQSAAATIEIEKLVQEIQAETGEVAVAMEKGIQQVVEGTNLVNETRQNLNAIVAATAEISKLLKLITGATQAQMVQSVSVTASMKDVAERANKTFAESNEITDVFQQLSAMAQELLATASKFKVN